jgi:hypothetical protein
VLDQPDFGRAGRLAFDGPDSFHAPVPAGSAGSPARAGRRASDPFVPMMKRLLDRTPPRPALPCPALPMSQSPPFR